MTLTLYINLSLILLSRGSGVRIPPGSPEKPSNYKPFEACSYFLFPKKQCKYILQVYIFILALYLHFFMRTY